MLPEELTFSTPSITCHLVNANQNTIWSVLSPSTAGWIYVRWSKKWMAIQVQVIRRVSMELKKESDSQRNWLNVWCSKLYNFLIKLSCHPCILKGPHLFSPALPHRAGILGSLYCSLVSLHSYAKTWTYQCQLKPELVGYKVGNKNAQKSHS